MTAKVLTLPIQKYTCAQTACYKLGGAPVREEAGLMQACHPDRGLNSQPLASQWDRQELWSDVHMTDGG